jgi:hypothetical protein
LLDSVEDDAAFAVEHVVELGGAPVVVELRPVDVHGVDPGRG